jgi:hypothetical protein
MNNEWLSTSSFEQMYEVISAINTISIHAKLTLAGVSNPAKKADIEQAKKNLWHFIDRFQNLIQSSEQESNGTIIGADPRLGKLAVRYLSEKSRLSTQTVFYDISFDELKELIESEQPGNLSKLIQCLKDLRSLIAQHSYADVTDLLGEI